MYSLSFFRVKHFYSALIVILSFFFSFSSARAQQCWADFYTYQVSPYGQLCSPSYVTLRTEYYEESGNYIYGEFRWYNTDTDPYPVYSQTVSSDNIPMTSDYSLYANNGTTIWVSFYNYYTGCETDRQPYTFYISPSAYLYQDYASQCQYDPAKVQLSSNVSGVYFYLYKLTQYYDPYYGYVQNYEYQQSNTTGYFEISYFDPADVNNYYARVVQSYGCSVAYYYPIEIEVVPATPPAITGNLSVTAGTSTTLYANGITNNYKWYDASGNFLQDGYAFSTPASLTDNTYLYQLRGVSSDGTCMTDPAFATVTVNLPTISYTSLYNSSNFTKTIDLSKPVGTISGVAAASPSGAVTYNIPVYTPPGTAGSIPTVSLTYNSQAPNGIAGYGWNISGLSAVSRNGKDIYHNGVVTPVAYTSDDAFMLDGLRLNPLSGSNGADGTVYASETENFARIVSNGGSSNNPGWFMVTTKDGTVMEYGNSTDSRIMTDDGASVMLWRLNKVKDVRGNYIEFHYDNGYRDSRLDEIDYTGNSNTGLLPYNSIKFNYAVRSDVATTYMTGASSTSKHILNSITVKSEGNLVKTYQLNYGFDNMYSLLKEVKESGSDGVELNSTIFLYGNSPTGLAIESSSVVAGSAVDIYTGDFNGDGISDILASSYQYSNFIKYNTDYTIYTRSSQNSTFQPLYTVPLNTSWQVINSKQVPFGRNFIATDFDGDGRDDILLTQSHVQNIYYGTRRIDAIQINYSKDGTYNSVGFPFPQVFDVIYGYQTCSLVEPPGNYIIPGDFDGDGASDFITFLRPDASIFCYSFLTCPRAGITNAGISPPDNMTIATIAGANSIQPIDFDGDGKMELMVTINTTTYILSVTPYIDIFAGSLYKFNILYQTNSINSNCKVWPGDFNGDRKTDLLVNNPSGGRYILYTNGKSFIQQAFGFNQSVDITNDKILVADFNGDGKSDVLHGYNYFVNGSASTSKLSVYYSRGNPLLGFNYEQSDYNRLLGFTPLVVADLNGDGRNDFINRNFYGDPFAILYLKPNGTERMLAKVTNGFNATTSFSYKTLTDKTTTPAVYNRTISLDNAANHYPYNYSQPPLYVVSSVTSPNGAGSTNTINYSYEDAIVHKPAKGFLGFNKVTSIDPAMGITSVTESQVNTDFAVSYPVKQTRKLTSTGEVLSQITINASFISLSTGDPDPRRFVQHVDKVLSVDNLTGAATENSYSYDNYGNITTSVAKTGAPSGSTVDPAKTVTTTTSYGIHNTPVPARPDNITISTVRTGMTAQNKTTAYTYTTSGLPATETLFSGQPKAVTTTYTYNGLGNATQVTTSSAGLANRTVNCTYDNYGRFEITKQAGIGATAQTESFTYDSKWGKPLSRTSTDCLTSTFEYDGFGRLKKTNLQAGYSITTTLNWDVSGDVLFYEYNNIPGGNPSTKIWFDKLGRQTKKQTAGFNNQWLTQLTNYDVKGNIATTTNDYYQGETPLTTTNSYDGYNRVNSVSNALTTNTFTYTTLGGGKLQVTTQNAGGQTSSKTTDATGKVVSTTDNGGVVDFNYNSSGQQVAVIHGGTTMTTMGFDIYGRQTTLVDKNAGTITYQYDALGQLIQQTDNNGNTHNMTYDDLGRITSTQGPEGTSTYEYYKDNGAGCSNNNLSKVTAFSGVVKEYTFDNLKRLQSEKVTIDGTANITQYGYNTYGDVTSITYPSGVIVNKNYNSSGQLLSVTGGDPGSQTTLFTGTQMNGSGQYTQYTLGNGRTGQNTYNFGIPTRFYTAGIQDLNLTYDYTKGNLLIRQDIIKGITESFQYDNLNRLTQTSVNSQVQINTGYDNNAGHSLGNIMSKTDAGNYVYKTDKVNAVAYITNPAGATSPPVTTSTTNQVISYTPFLKTGSITQGNYQLSYVYDADFQRAKSVLQQNAGIIETKYYLGDYEKQISGGTTREIHLVNGGNGECAVIVRQNGVNTIYSVYIDHLNSVLTVTDVNANIVAEQNFDGWGRNRNPQNWTYSSVPSVPAWLYRGYTGHEHLPQFALVNMNGRIYDPVEGRMLSPDNYVAKPFNSQGYNRYAYAMNNPLVYTDPSGDIIFTLLAAIFCPALIPLGVAMDVGSIVNTMSNLDRINNFWDGLKYYGAGAGGGAAAYLWGPVAGFAIGGGLNIAADATVKNPETGENYLSRKSDFGDFLKSGITGGLSAIAGYEAYQGYTGKDPGTTFEKVIKGDGKYKYWKYAYTGAKNVLSSYVAGDFDGKDFGQIGWSAFKTMTGAFASGMATDYLTPDYSGESEMNGQKIFDRKLPYFNSKLLSSVMGNGISNFISTGYIPSLFPVYSDPSANYKLNYDNLSGASGDIFIGMALYFKRR